MKVRCIDDRLYLVLTEEGYFRVQPSEGHMHVSLTIGMIYEVVSVEEGWYRIVDDTGGSYLYPPYTFEVVEDVST